MKTIPILIIIIFLLLIIFSAYSYQTEQAKKSNLRDMILHPEKYDLLPDNLAPYCCGEVIDGKCNAKVDLKLAADLIKSGLAHDSNYAPPRSQLSCS